MVAADSPSPPERGRWAVTECLALVVFAGVALWLIFGELGASSFHDGDEALYATVARAMAERNDFFTPSYWGRPFLHKPPLPYWLMAIASKTVSHTHEFQARLPSALSALALLAVTYGFARRLAGFGPALLCAAVLLANHQFLFEHAARSASFDSLLTLFMFAALMAGLSAPGGVASRWLFPVCVGAVALVKAPLVVFPVAIVFVRRRIQAARFSVRDLTRTGAIVAVVALPWHLYQALVHGRDFWNAYFVYEIAGRAGATLRDPLAHAFIHLEAAWMSFLPWSPLLLLALAGLAAGWPRSSSDESGGSARAVAFYGVAILVFFCIIPSKWPWYGLPAYPAVAVALAVFVHRILHSSWRVALPGLFAALAGLCFFLLGTDAAYAPATRSSYLWPIRTQFYGLDPSLHGTAGVLFGIVLVLLALLPFLRARWNERGLVAGGSVAGAALILGLQFQALARVPRVHQSPISRLASVLEDHGVRQIYAVGFFHEERYGGRQEPLSSYYLLGVRGALVTDCGGTIACVPAASNGVRSAVVVRDRALDPEVRQQLFTRMGALTTQFEVYRLSADDAGGFERL